MQEKRKKYKRIAFWGTFVTAGTMLVLLILFGFSTPLPLPEEEGILVNFGYEASASPSQAIEQVSEVVPQEQVEQVSPPPSETEVQEKEVLTQDFEDAAAIEAKKKKEKERKEEQERIRKEKEERERIEREKREKEQREREQQEKINQVTKNAFSSGNNNGTESSDGNKTGEGDQGSPDGDKNANNYGEGKGLSDKGIGFSLKGRNPVGGKLPKPKYTSNEEGVVVIRVTVKQDGTVSSATYSAKGSNTTSQTLIRAAREAALQAKFNTDYSADAYQVGTITYRFVLN
eukprot:Anaeramoba_ignava/a478224_18.p1 GENE.a478224_18~~a478224_18.p1  ORF type:complete len:288 (+),score=55.96 a478224_18:1164-2027(+)